MSAPLSAEQRAAAERLAAETWRLATDAEGDWWYGAAPAETVVVAPVVGYGVLATNDDGIPVVSEVQRAADLALVPVLMRVCLAALVERTCGTCPGWGQYPVFPDRGTCWTVGGSRSRDDGCLKHWTARPSQTETTP